MALLVAWLWTFAVAVLPLPAEGPAIANALLFDGPVAVAVTWSGCLLGACLSYELAFWGGRSLALRVLGEAGMARVDRLGMRAGGLGLLGVRLLPAISFTGINWAAGLAAIDRKTFVATTAIGIVPGCIAFTLLAQGGAAWLPAGVPQGVGLLLVGGGLAGWALRRLASDGRDASETRIGMLRARTFAGAVAGVALAAALFAVAPTSPDPSKPPESGMPLASTPCAEVDTSSCCTRRSDG